ncbi:MAG: helix-turn-helix domain-containing protein [Defluviitaleaceae bacterium]|nr:helix-turn-helix domain-containing protein [Defluviitaleaceae bacterium]
MNTKQAVAKRIVELCEQKGVTINAIANISGVPPMTLYSILNSKSKNPGIVTIKKLCDGLEITLGQFFDTPEFDVLEQEIK